MKVKSVGKGLKRGNNLSLKNRLGVARTRKYKKSGRKSKAKTVRGGIYNPLRLFSPSTSDIFFKKLDEEVMPKIRALNENINELSNMPMNNNIDDKNIFDILANNIRLLIQKIDPMLTMRQISNEGSPSIGVNIKNYISSQKQNGPGRINRLNNVDTSTIYLIELIFYFIKLIYLVLKTHFNMIIVYSDIKFDKPPSRDFIKSKEYNIIKYDYDNIGRIEIKNYKNKTADNITIKTNIDKIITDTDKKYMLISYMWSIIDRNNDIYEIYNDFIEKYNILKPEYLLSSMSNFQLKIDFGFLSRKFGENSNKYIKSFIKSFEGYNVMLSEIRSNYTNQLNKYFIDNSDDENIKSLYTLSSNLKLNSGQTPVSMVF